jgi:hypothetical protein
MLFLTKEMRGATIEAADGKLGKLVDFLFDDRDWSIKSLVLDAGTWLNSRRVTLPPDLIRHKDWADHRLMIHGLTREQVVNSPNVESHLAVGESVNNVGEPTKLESATIVDWGLYWIQILDHPWQVSDDPHIRNTEEMIRYHLCETDGRVGHLLDFLVDDESWKIRFLEADARNWWPHKRVLVAPSRVEKIDGEKRIVHINLTRHALEHSLVYHPAMDQAEQYETLTNMRM